MILPKRPRDVPEAFGVADDKTADDGSGRCVATDEADEFTAIPDNGRIGDRRTGGSTAVEAAGSIEQPGEPSLEQTGSRRRTWMAGAAVGLASVVVANRLADRRSTAINATPVAIGGASMYPTARPPIDRWRCEGCGNEFDRLPLAAGDPADQTACPRCGQTSSRIGGRPVDVLQMVTNDDPVRSGEVVAIKINGRPSIKRVFAIGGQRVDLRGNRLMVNGQRPNFATAEIPPKRVSIFESERLRPAFQSVGNGGWVYQHFGGRLHQPTPIDDDISINDVARPLSVVDAYQIHLQTDQPPMTVQVCISNGILKLTPRTTPTGLTYDSRLGRRVETPWPLSLTRPIGLRVQRPGQISYIRIDRSIIYRINRRHRRDVYPMTVPADHVFLVGDNTPVSLDSRDFGPVNIANIHGSMRSSRT